MTRIGFWPPDPHYDPENYAEASDTIGTGTSHADIYDEPERVVEEDWTWEFPGRVFLAIQIGPFALVIGHPKGL